MGAAVEGWWRARAGEPGRGPDPALVVGDPAGRAAVALRRLGWRVVRLAPGAGRSEPDRLAGADVLGRAACLPFAAERFGAVVLSGVLEFTREDDIALDEACRVLRPGGRLVVRVPAAGPLGGSDPFNLYRYLQETSGRGDVPPELSELAWRRRYRPGELADLLAPLPLRAHALEGGGLGVADLAALGSLVAARWAAGRPELDRALRRRLAPLAEAEVALARWRWGPMLTGVAERVNAP